MMNGKWRAVNNHEWSLFLRRVSGALNLAVRLWSLIIKRNHTPLTLWRDLFTSVSSCVFRSAERMECGEPSPL
jgi:hypothetical protein